MRFRTFTPIVFTATGVFVMLTGCSPNKHTVTFTNSNWNTVARNPKTYTGATVDVAAEYFSNQSTTITGSPGKYLRASLVTDDLKAPGVFINWGSETSKIPSSGFLRVKGTVSGTLINGNVEISPKTVQPISVRAAYGPLVKAVKVNDTQSINGVTLTVHDVWFEQKACLVSVTVNNEGSSAINATGFLSHQPWMKGKNRLHYIANVQGFWKTQSGVYPLSLPARSQLTKGSHTYLLIFQYPEITTNRARYFVFNGMVNLNYNPRYSEWVTTKESVPFGINIPLSSSLKPVLWTFHSPYVDGGGLTTGTLKVNRVDYYTVTISPGPVPSGYTLQTLQFQDTIQADSETETINEVGPNGGASGGQFSISPDGGIISFGFANAQMGSTGAFVFTFKSLQRKTYIAKSEPFYVDPNWQQPNNTGQSRPPASTIPPVSLYSKSIGLTIPRLQHQISDGSYATVSTVLVQGTTGISGFGGTIPNVKFRTSDQVYLAVDPSGDSTNMHYLVVRNGIIVVDMTILSSNLGVNSFLPSAMLQTPPAEDSYGSYVVLRWALSNAIEEAITFPAGKGDVNYYPVQSLIQYAPSVGSN